MDACTPHNPEQDGYDAIVYFAGLVAEAARVQALDEAAKVCDEQQLEGECPERASYCAAAIRLLGEDAGRGE